MLHFQPSLPRLPIPKLENTCARYLAALEPLLDGETFARTSAIVKDFQATVGPQLQSLLQAHDKANKHTSYISEPWFHMYLSDRQPLPLNYNPLLIMTPHDQRPELNNQRLQATNYVISSLRFMRSLRAQQLGPEVFHLNPKESDTEKYRRIMRLTPSAISTYVSYLFKAYPLDMSQYQGLFGATRIPEQGKDRISRNTTSRHIVVLRNGHFYSVDVLDRDGNIEEPDAIHSRLAAVFNAPEAENEYALGHLTATDRDTWADLRKHLLAVSDENLKSLEAVDSALFAVCLDNGAGYDDANPVPLIREGLFDNAANRWFDKSFSLLVAADGTASVNFEHSWGDGVAVMRYCNEVCQDVKRNPFVTEIGEAPTQGAGTATRIEFTLDDRMKEGIRRAKANHRAICDDLDMGIVREFGMGKKTCKVNKVSPDSIMQLGMQLAYYKQFGKFTSTYESCSTAAFRHGRTETMRPCTVHTKAFCEQVETKKNRDKTELRAIINRCSAYHGELTKNAAMGQGFDRHLFGLRHTAEQNGMEKPELFRDPAYAMINHNVISTSTLSSPNIVAGAFGPVVPDGFGMAYGIMEDELGVVVANYKRHQKNAQMVDALKESYKVIAEVLRN